MRRILVGVVMVLGARVARADDKKDAARAVREQIANLFDNADHPGAYGDGGFTTGLAGVGTVDGDGLRAALADYVFQYAYVSSAKVKDLKVAVDAGGEGAWASCDVHVEMFEDENGDAPLSFDLRATELLDKTSDGWKVIAGHWSKAVPDKDAKKTTATLATLADQDAAIQGASLIDTLRASELGKVVSTRADVFVYGTDAKKPRLGGKKTATAWKAWWKQVTVEGKVAGGENHDQSVGWLAANLAIHKGKVTIPARVFLILARDDQDFRVVAAQLSVPKAGPEKNY